MVADRDGAAVAGEPALAGAGGVVAEELLEVVTAQLAQGRDRWVVLAEPPCEQGQASGSGLDRFGAQRR